ncbi:MAG: hypothetical protein IJ785_08290 [Bacteroidales bacterium]|nr:hypothetical protein [Bacteroidales bacterium]
MKRTILMSLATAAVVCLFASCSEKEGVYSPKKQISKVYESSTSIYQFRDETDGGWNSDTNVQPKTLAEEWTWDGKKLSRIAFYETHNVNEKSDPYEVVNFTYDGSQLTRAESDDEYMEITYDGKKLKQAKIFEKNSGENVLMMTFDFEHDGKKVSKITFSTDFADMEDSRMERLLFRGLMPTFEQADRTLNLIAKATSRFDGAKASISLPFTLTWSGNNISSMSTTYPAFGMSATVNYSYDNKNNPYQNFLFGLIGFGEQTTFPMFNENNITKAVMTASMLFFGDPETEEVTYAYTYDGDWPLTQTYTETDDDEDYRHQATTTRYFEYK